MQSTPKFTLSQSNKIIREMQQEQLVCLGCLEPPVIRAVMDVAPIKLTVPGFVYVPVGFAADAFALLQALPRCT